MRILQHNTLAWTFGRRFELYNVYRSLDPDIILINAHGLTGLNKIKMFGYTVYQKNQFDQPHDGVAIAIKKHLQHAIIDDFDENYQAIKIYTTLGPIVIATGYQPPRRPIIPPQSLLHIFRRNLPVLFAGDLNARHQLLGLANNPNPAGELVAHHLQHGNVTHNGPDFQTFITTRSAGTPDIVLTNDRWIHNLNIQPGPITTSDHLPIIITVSAAPIQVPITPVFNKKQANWDNFKSDLINFQPHFMDGQPLNVIDTELQNWFMAVERAMGNNIPLKRYKTLPGPKTTNEVRRLINIYHLARQTAQRDGWTPVLRNMIKGIQNSLQQQYKQLQEESWNEAILHTEINYREPGKFWNNIKRLMGNDTEQLKFLLDPHGNKLTTHREQAEEFKRVWQKIYQISDEENEDFCERTERTVLDFLHANNSHRPYDDINLSRLQPNNELIKPINIAEVTFTIKSLKSRKAPGYSKIDKEILLKLPPNMITALTGIFNAALSAGRFPDKFKLAVIKLILKSGKISTSPLNYRPISLLETVGKVFERILNDRLRRHLEIQNLYHRKQHAYRKNRGTVTAISLAYETISRHQQNRAQCNVVMRDVSKAFDKVWHDGLKFKLCTLDMPRPITALLSDFLTRRTALIQVGAHTTSPFPLLCGVPQGSTLAPTLFSIYTSDIGEIPHCEYFTYADDVTQVVTYPGKSKRFLQLYTERAIQALNNYEYKWKIRTNQNKFQILHISKQRPLPITINNRVIRFTNRAKLLGLTLKKTGIAAQVDEKTAQASTVLKKLRRFSKLQERTKLHLYKALVMPVLEYPPVPLNTLTNSNWRKLQTIQNRALRWIAGEQPPYTTNAVELHHRYQLLPLNQRNYIIATRHWEKMRTHFTQEIEDLLAIETVGTHAWWPASYIGVDAPSPEPIIV